MASNCDGADGLGSRDHVFEGHAGKQDEVLYGYALI